jgi:hypothetical protein
MSLVTEILFYRGALVNMPTLPIGMPAFATDTHELFVGTLTGNAKIGVPRISDGNYGDITVSVGGTVYTINAGAISLSDLAPIATQQILGRATAGIGPVESFSWLTLLSVLASTPNSIPVWNGSLWTELVPGTAAAGVLKSGGGAPSWAPIATYAFEERQTQGTNSGTFTQGVWQPRQLNTTVINSDGLASLSANVVTLPAGKYVVRARVPAVGVNRHQSSLRRVLRATLIASHHRISGQPIQRFWRTSRSQARKGF